MIDEEIVEEIATACFSSPVLFDESFHARTSERSELCSLHTQGKGEMTNTLCLWMMCGQVPSILLDILIRNAVLALLSESVFRVGGRMCLA